MATASTAAHPQRLVLYGEPWETYLRLLRAFEERSGVRITYDRGALELMTLGPEHERLNYLLGRLVDVLIEELGWESACYGSMTMKRRKRRRGLEPDRCYWIANESAVRGQDHIDLRRVPPPDLVLEIEVTRHIVNRLPVYAALRVPEVWRSNGQQVRFCVLDAKGNYVETARSVAFPFLESSDLESFLALRTRLSNAALTRQFRDWIRASIAKNWQRP